MTAFHGEGWFWVEGREDEAVPGTMSVDLDSRPAVTLLKPFLSDGFKRPSGSTPVLLGMVGKEPVTLVEVAVIGFSSSSIGNLASRERLTAHCVVVGAHLPVVTTADGTATIEIDAVVAEIGSVDEWVDLNRCEVAEFFDPQHGNYSGSSITYQVPDPLSADCSDGSIEFQPEWNRPSFYTADEGLTTGTLFRASWPAPVPLERGLRRVGQVQSLMTLLRASSSALKGLRVHHPACCVGEREGRSIYEEVTLYLPWAQEADDGADSTSTQWSLPDRLLSFDDIGGVAGVAKWVNLSEQLDVVVALLCSPALFVRIPQENTFFNTCAAAEGLHRVWYPIAEDTEAVARTRRNRVRSLVRNAIRSGEDLPSGYVDVVSRGLRHAHEPSLAERLKQLCTRIPLTSKSLLKDVEQWAEAVSWMRNQLAHPNPPDEVDRRRNLGLEPPGAHEFHFVRHQVYWVLVALLLREIGVSDELLTERLNHPARSRAHEAAKRVTHRWSRDPGSGDAGFRSADAEPQ